MSNHSIDKRHEKRLVPIIISHTGVRGISNLDSTMVASCGVSEVREQRNMKFNTWEMNLLDEDIIRVYKSGGIIGVSLDQRVLGAHNKQYQRSIMKRLRNLHNPVTGQLRDWREAWHAVLFLDNLTHIIKVLQRYLKKGGKIDHSLDPWDIVSLSFDFDATIEPINNCPSEGYLGSFEIELNAYFDQYVDHEDLPYLEFNESFTISQALRKVFKTNMKLFLKNLLV